jgi:hypothetical protein
VPDRPAATDEIPVGAVAEEPISSRTGTPAGGIWASILVLLDPDDQTPVVGSDDFKQDFAGFDWVAEKTGTYRLKGTRSRASAPASCW